MKRFSAPLKILLAVFVLSFFLFQGFAEADSNGYILRGTAKTLFSVFEIPKTMIEHSQQVVFPVGLVSGAVTGAFRTVFGTLGGVLDIARGALPYAKYAVFFI